MEGPVTDIALVGLLARVSEPRKGRQAHQQQPGILSCIEEEQIQNKRQRSSLLFGGGTEFIQFLATLAMVH